MTETSIDPDTAADAWFRARGWAVLDFQRQVWSAMRAGRSGLLHATTGSGKTYAVWLGALARRGDSCAEGRGRALVDAADLAIRQRNVTIFITADRQRPRPIERPASPSLSPSDPE